MLKQAWTSTYKSYVITKRPLKTLGITEKIKWSHADLNRRPPACHAGALPAELWPQDKVFLVTPIDLMANRENEWIQILHKSIRFTNGKGWSIRGIKSDRLKSFK